MYFNSFVNLSDPYNLITSNLDSKSFIEIDFNAKKEASYFVSHIFL